MNPDEYSALINEIKGRVPNPFQNYEPLGQDPYVTEDLPGFTRSRKLFTQGATLGLFGSDVTPRTLGEQATAFAGSIIPTVAATSLTGGLATGPTLGPTLARVGLAAPKLAKLGPLAAAPYVPPAAPLALNAWGKIASAGVTGGLYGTAEGIIKGEPLPDVVRRAAESVAYWSGGEAVFVGAQALRALRNAAKGKVTGPEVGTVKSVAGQIKKTQDVTDTITSTFDPQLTLQNAEREAEAAATQNSLQTTALNQAQIPKTTKFGPQIVYEPIPGAGLTPPQRFEDWEGAFNPFFNDQIGVHLAPGTTPVDIRPGGLLEREGQLSLAASTDKYVAEKQAKLRSNVEAYEANERIQQAQLAEKADALAVQREAELKRRADLEEMRKSGGGWTDIQEQTSINPLDSPAYDAPQARSAPPDLRRNALDWWNAKNDRITLDDYVESPTNPEGVLRRSEAPNSKLPMIEPKGPAADLAAKLQEQRQNLRETGTQFTPEQAASLGRNEVVEQFNNVVKERQENTASELLKAAPDSKTLDDLLDVRMISPQQLAIIDLTARARAASALEQKLLTPQMLNSIRREADRLVAQHKELYTINKKELTKEAEASFRENHILRMLRERIPCE